VRTGPVEYLNMDMLSPLVDYHPTLLSTVILQADFDIAASPAVCHCMAVLLSALLCPTTQRCFAENFCLHSISDIPNSLSPILLNLSV
jgi:hypothetical protein